MSIEELKYREGKIQVWVLTATSYQNDEEYGLMATFSSEPNHADVAQAITTASASLREYEQENGLPRGRDLFQMHIDWIDPDDVE